MVAVTSPHFFELCMVINPRLAVRCSLSWFLVIQECPVSANISGCRALLKLPSDTLFDLAVLEKLRFAVGILMIFVIFSEI